MRKNDTLTYELTGWQTIVIFVYYFVLMLAGAAVAIMIACGLAGDETRTLLIKKTFAASLSVSGMLCSIQYIKRLYKACLTHRINENCSFWGQVGTMAYFLLRPFYSFAFVIVMIFALLSGMFAVTGNLDFFINEKFLYLCVIFSSFLGYSVGHVLDKFESISKEKIESVK